MSGQDGWRSDMENAPRNRDIYVWGSVEMSAHSRPHMGCEDIERVIWSESAESWAITSTQADGWVPQPSHWREIPAAPTPERAAS